VVDKDAVWYELLKFRYGDQFGNLLSRDSITPKAKDSIWWRDMVKMGVLNEYWFPKNVSSVLGDGKRIGFWKEKWIGVAPLQELFPNLYAKEADQFVMVAKRLVGQSLNRIWNWNWCNNMTANEEDELEEMQQLLFGVEVVEDQQDIWRWIADSAGLFSIKSVYVLLLNGRNMIDINQATVAALESLWKNDIPSKVGVFGWRLILEKLPTRAPLATRGILSNTHYFVCVFYFHDSEDCRHFFFNCHIVKQVWSCIFVWMGCEYIHNDEGWKHFNDLEIF
jgi:hypothetical protein